MTALVTIDTKTGELTRYECGGANFRKSHYAIPNNGPAALTPPMIEQFRHSPPSEFSVEPPPQPPLPPAQAARVDDGLPCDVENTATLLI